MNKEDARRRAWVLYRDLQGTVARDPEQEVRGIAFPVVDICLTAFAGQVIDDEVVAAIHGLFTPEAIDEGVVRSVDAMVVAGQLAAALGPEHPPAGARSESPSDKDGGLFGRNRLNL